jgi:hypothetical protein
MPHKVNIDSIYENIFLLVNVCFGAKAFAKSRDLSYQNEDEVLGGHFYYGWLQAVVSEKLIDTSIKSRIVFDIVMSQQREFEEDGSGYGFDLPEADERICAEYNIGCLYGDGTVSLRDACNKIIHAEGISYSLEAGDEEHDFDEEREEKREWKYWDGVVAFSGQRGPKRWQFDLHVNDFCFALAELLLFLEDNVDWHRLHKYDWPV